MPRRKPKAVPEEHLGRDGTYGFAAVRDDGSLPDPTTKYSVEINVPEMAVIQFALQGVVDAIETLLPKDAVSTDGPWRKVDASKLSPEMRAQVSMLAVVTEALHHMIEASQPMGMVHGPNGEFGVTAYDPKRGPAVKGN